MDFFYFAMMFFFDKFKKALSKFKISKIYLNHLKIKNFKVIEELNENMFYKY